MSRGRSGTSRSVNVTRARRFHEGGQSDHAWSIPSGECGAQSLRQRPKQLGDDPPLHPTELIYRCWPHFAVDSYRMLDCRFVEDGKLITGQELVRQGRDTELLNRAALLRLGEAFNESNVRERREKTLTDFRSDASHLRDEFEQRYDTWLVDSDSVVGRRLLRLFRWLESKFGSSALVDRIAGWLTSNKRVAIPADPVLQQTLLESWRRQSAYEKSRTLIQCPPQSWIDAYEASSASRQDPRLNPAIDGHENERVAAFQIQSTAVTSEMFQQFEPAYQGTSRIGKSYRGSSDVELTFLPANEINWFDAWCFARWIGSEFCLPNEFQWEHACRAGTETEYHFGDELNGDNANCDGNYPWSRQSGDSNLAKGPYEEGCHPVGHLRYPANRYGLFDVHGNVREWCEDWYSESSRVLRGGSWFLNAVRCRSAYRDVGVVPGFRYDSRGFVCVVWSVLQSPRPLTNLTSDLCPSVL